MSSSQTLKRKFAFTTNSEFNTAKKFKFFSSSASSMQDSMNSSIQTLDGPSLSKPNFTVPQPFVFQTELRSRKSATFSTEDLEVQLIQARPRFKARPMPKFKPVFDSTKNFPTENPCEAKFNNEKWSQNTANCSSISCSETSRQGSVIRKQWDLNLAESRFSMNENGGNCEKSEFGLRNQFQGNLKELAGSRIDCDEIRKNEGGDVFKFVAKPMPDFSRVFTPITGNTPTQPMNIELSTQKRAIEREKFESFLKDKENINKEIKAMELAAEAEEIKNYRKTLEFKARPLQELRPFLVNRSEEELTHPKSPVLLTALRADRKKPLENDENFMDID
jgi:hypothetical protein